jgi:predicted transglutaminase-like cysteine proteinase
MSISFNDLKLVNSKINMLPYASEVEDDWKPIVTEGDCDSSATAKFERLVDMGWPTNFLRLATCYVETGGRLPRCPASRLGRSDLRA